MTTTQKAAAVPRQQQDETAGFAERLLQWFDAHGRKDLPWQLQINAYRVWVSEIMLQQTQVATVIPYFQRFMHRFPDVHSLASAAEDEVLHLWSGLGYYSRARNLHNAARIIVQQHAGALPRDVDTWQSLPGVGRSTAAAICAISYDSPDAILDGNVKRVLARHFAVPGWPGQSSVSKQLWALAESCTPVTRNRDYTQAIMDLGATLCVRSKPQCERCPVTGSCAARLQNNIAEFPGRKPKRNLPLRETRMLLVENVHGELLLCKRPPAGIWGGLWSLPEQQQLTPPLQALLAAAGEQRAEWPVLRHSFTHFHLDITPVHHSLATPAGQTSATAIPTNDEASGVTVSTIMEAPDWLWYNVDEPADIGLPAPVSRLLAQFAAQRETGNFSLRSRQLPTDRFEIEEVSA